MRFINKRGDIEMDQVGYIILGVILLLILIYIITQVIGGEYDSQEEKVKDIFSIFK